MLKNSAALCGIIFMLSFSNSVHSDEFPSSSEVLDPPSSPDPLSDQATISPQPERIPSLSATENPEMQVAQSDRNESKIYVQLQELS